MSVSVGRRGDNPLPGVRHSPLARAYLWSIVGMTLLIMTPGVAQLTRDPEGYVELLAWAAVVAIVDLLPVNVWGSVSVSMSFPVTLAAGMIFLPTEAALIAFIGSFDPREFRGGVSLAKSLFNRSQVAFSVMAGSTAYHVLGGEILQWPSVLLPGICALVLDAACNFALVGSAVAVESRISPRRAMINMFGSSPWHYFAAYLLLGLLALPLAAAVAVGGFWALLAFLAPVVLTREMFRQTQRLSIASERIRYKDQALRVAAGDAVRERRDERLVLAGELHDEVLPSLFKVHLMGQVIKQDLASGMLLALDEDLPQLLEATDHAQRAVRDLLGDLRRSPLGPAGLLPTLRLLIDQLSAAGAPPVTVDAEPVDGSPLAQLLTYQVVREALHNSAKHAKAQEISVRVWLENNVIRLSVTDDGCGFAWANVDTHRHFGLQIMKERVESVGGTLLTDSRLGSGTMVIASIPRDA
jgi:signal transduction histidine kinase